MNKTIKKTLLISLIAIMLISTSITILPTQAVTVAPPNWDVTGTWKFNFKVDGWLSYDTSLYTVTFVQIGNSITGNGLYPSTEAPSYGWSIVGTVIGDNIEFTCNYNLGAIGTVMHIVGTIAPDGSMNGRWDDNYGDGGRVGDWKTTEGFAVRIIADGAVHLTDLPEGVTSVTGGVSTFPVPLGGVGDTYSIELFSGTLKISGEATIVIHYTEGTLSIADQLLLRIWQFDYRVGDINKDGKVNLVDIALITKALGSTDGTLVPPPKYFTITRWDSRCDLNGDHKVDLKDMGLALNNYGKSPWFLVPGVQVVDTVAHTITATALIDSGFGVR